jgi:hypothetical protein
MPVRTTVAPSPSMGSAGHRGLSVDHQGMTCPAGQSEPGLIYCPAHRPPFDGRSSVRYDRRPSNPDLDHVLGEDAL